MTQQKLLEYIRDIFDRQLDIFLLRYCRKIVNYYTSQSNCSINMTTACQSKASAKRVFVFLFVLLLLRLKLTAMVIAGRSVT